MYFKYLNEFLVSILLLIFELQQKNKTDELDLITANWFYVKIPDSQ